MPECQVYFLYPAYFQFPLWDSFIGFFARHAYVLIFQFPLWDSPKEVYNLDRRSKSFNSLYGIHYTSNASATNTSAFNSLYGIHAGGPSPPPAQAPPFNSLYGIQALPLHRRFLPV